MPTPERVADRGDVGHATQSSRLFELCGGIHCVVRRKGEWPFNRRLFSDSGAELSKSAHGKAYFLVKAGLAGNRQWSHGDALLVNG
ncbi:hypothetical protein [Micromonospora chersina]|uniref:hypothetical protein n=1 Tax=Micromonospora chersina TaxID=47854 RepID=UPI0033E42FB4